MSASAKPRVFVTRRVPESGPSLLRTQCEVSQWDKDDPIPRSELLVSVKGVDALFCLLTDKIDSEVLDAAGEATRTGRQTERHGRRHMRTAKNILTHAHTR